MKATELREKSVEELETSLIELMKSQFSHRMQHSTGQLGQPHLLKEVGRDIARVKTIMAEKSRAGE